MTSRFLKSVIASAKSETVVLPYARGTRRAAFVAKRKAAPEPMRKSA